MATLNILPHPTVVPEFIINHDGAIVAILRNWVLLHDAQSLFQSLTQHLPWEQKEQNFYGNVVQVPRLMCAVGDPHLQQYQYTRVSLPMHDWYADNATFRAIRLLRDRIQSDPELVRITGQPLPYDGCLLNYYRTGADTIDFHSDREALGPANAVVALSLGASRKFVLKSKTKGPTVAYPNCPASRFQRVETIVHSGDLMIMAGTCQELWTHAVPRDPTCHETRISLTYRLTGRK